MKKVVKFVMSKCFQGVKIPTDEVDLKLVILTKLYYILSVFLPWYRYTGIYFCAYRDLLKYQTSKLNATVINIDLSSKYELQFYKQLNKINDI